jgi:hypothetical protein
MQLGGIIMYVISSGTDFDDIKFTQCNLKVLHHRHVSKS